MCKPEFTVVLSIALTSILQLRVMKCHQTQQTEKMPKPIPNVYNYRNNNMQMNL